MKGAINSTLSWTKAATYTAIRSVLPAGIPNNEGVFRAITVSAPSGTITNAVLPAACAARGLTGFRMVDCAFGALAMMLPDKVFAASDGGNTGITIGGYDDQRKPFIYVDFTCGTWGARPWADGLDGNSNIFANMASQSVEVTEAEYPLQILSYEFVPDRAGAGRYRGGTPFRRDYRFPRVRRAAPGALRPPHLPPLRALWREPRSALAQRDESGAGRTPAAEQAHGDDPAWRCLPPRARRRRRLGRSAGARSCKPCCATCATS